MCKLKYRLVKWEKHIIENIYTLKEIESMYRQQSTGCGKSTFIVVGAQNSLFLYYYLLFYYFPYGQL